MEGLLRKYKISKISDTVKLTEQELNICQTLDKCLIGLNEFKCDNSIYFINNDNYGILEYDTISNNLYVSGKHCWNYLNLPYCDSQMLIQIWVESYYKLNINMATYFLTKFPSSRTL